jgi:GT2 family glycosyltransferase
MRSMDRRVCIGVTVHAQPAMLRETVQFLHLHTDLSADLVVLPDGPDAETRAALSGDVELSSLTQWPTAEARGTAAAFNRLAAATDAAVIVLLESGSLVGPRWLELLLAALKTSGCGLAGPSTNLGWNEQALGWSPIDPAASASVAAPPERLAVVRAMSARTLQRFGREVRALGPLHSLGDFCYAVRREVITAIGDADEGYGLGPCWEMDYNIRAARAGFTGVWVCGAYVHRSPPTARRTAHETAHGEASRHRYQDQFCGLRLAGRTESYEPHCRGDACEHFAPPHLVNPHARRRDSRERRRTPTGPRTAVAPPVRAVPAPSTGAPLVSCVMPTRGRADFALQAMHYFQQQDYRNLELVVVEDGDRVLAASLPDDPRIRLVSSGTVRSIGVMRNDACARARGEIMILWDDDDWHGPSRVSRQVAPILAGQADITALRDVPLLDVAAWRTWRWSSDLHRHMLALDVLGGTLAFHRSVWEHSARYPDDSLAEDAAFVRQAVRAGARLEALDATGVYVYVRHRANSWHLECGQSVDPHGWMAIDEPPLPAPDRAFYQSLAGVGSRGSQREGR